jgi:DNA-directed RNA polymerase subunit RPC12/RpoP
MKCDRCGEHIQAGEEMEHYRQTLCEACYIRPQKPKIARPLQMHWPGDPN